MNKTNIPKLIDPITYTVDGKEYLYRRVGSYVQFTGPTPPEGLSIEGKIVTIYTSFDRDSYYHSAKVIGWETKVVNPKKQTFDSCRIKECCGHCFPVKVKSEKYKEYVKLNEDDPNAFPWDDFYNDGSNFDHFLESLDPSKTYKITIEEI